MSDYMRGFQNREDPISIEKWPISFQKIRAPALLGVCPMWTYQNGAQVSYFLEKLWNLKKFNFRTFFPYSSGWKICFRGSTSQIEILEKIEKNRKSVREGRESWGNHSKPIFRSLGGPCGQNESYTSLVRPFPMKLCFGEVGAFLADFPETRFWSICGYVISREKKLHSKGNNFFVEVSSGKCLLGSYAWEILVFGSKTWFYLILQYFENWVLGFCWFSRKKWIFL